MHIVSIFYITYWSEIHSKLTKRLVMWNKGIYDLVLLCKYRCLKLLQSKLYRWHGTIYWIFWDWEPMMGNTFLIFYLHLITTSFNSEQVFKSDDHQFQFMYYNGIKFVCVCSNANPLHYYVLQGPHKAARWHWVWSIFNSRTAWQGQLARWRKWRACDVGEAKEGLDNKLWCR